jgi:predicted GNAT superfamily acetyltransferase
MPETGGLMVAAYVAAAVLYLSYSFYLLSKGRKKN